MANLDRDRMNAHTGDRIQDMEVVGHVMRHGERGIDGTYLAPVVLLSDALKAIDRARSYSKDAESDSKMPNGLQSEDCNPLISLENLAEWTGLEPATPGVTGREMKP